jgi:hypothetical protein
VSPKQKNMKKQKRIAPILLLSALVCGPAFALFNDGYDGIWGVKSGTFSSYGQTAIWSHYASNGDDYYQTSQEGTRFPTQPPWITEADARSNSEWFSNNKDEWAAE